MTEWITEIMNSLGYFGIAFLMFLENLFPPIPSELIMPLAGFTVAQGKMQLVPAIVAGVAGTILGAYPWYYAGKLVSEERLRQLADRHGRWLGLSSADIDKADRWLRKYGNSAVLFCRLVPGVRTLISLPAGVSEMPLIPFTIYSTIGSALWVGLLTIGGYKMGANYGLIETYIGPFAKIILLILVIFFILWSVKKKFFSDV
jgi:membrane protein DedA with SNARE-associated domain